MFVSCFEFRLDSLKKLCQASAVLSYEHVYIATLDVEVSKNVSCRNMPVVSIITMCINKQVVRFRSDFFHSN